MIEKIGMYLEFPLVRYALIVGVLIALCSSLLGVTLVLKRFSFIGDGLSHVAFGRAGHRLPAAEHFLRFDQPVRGRVLNPVRIHFDPHPETGRSLAVRSAVPGRHRDLRVLL